MHTIGLLGAIQPPLGGGVGPRLRGRGLVWGRGEREARGAKPLGDAGWEREARAERA